MSLFLRSFLFEGCGDHRDLHVLTHSFPTLRSSDLDRKMAVDPGDLSFLTVLFHDSPHGSVEAFAEGTLEIREFDHLYRGIRAAHDMVLAIDWPHGASCRAPPLLFRLLLLGLEPLHRLEDYLRVVEKVLADDLLVILALVRLKVPDRPALVGCPRRDRRGARSEERRVGKECVRRV